ncbi:uncharacterized protein LOC117589337 [Drosophila guanche]|uniref:Blast:Pseudouridylate synthase 7 homolog n=1 Tax=Drosophila guanche TaxID=7266 RepID=A0A3B0KFY1_DROGU|nr:uncharacterized protein LOC117589337 [Drosophila guanche]SPP87280.1 blast:Pseudouridylate synthase 7 homolog [Drosophila guanche]
MSDDFDSRLIRLIRGNPKLFEREIRSTPYAVKRKDKEELWRAIATSLQTDVKTCTTRWEHLKSKLHQELAKEAQGVGSTWSLLPKMKFLKPGGVAVRSPHPSDALIEEVHDEEDTLQEAMDEQCTGGAVASVSAQVPTSPTPALTPADTMKRVGVLLEGLGEEDCVKAGKRIIAYLCKCNLRALECKPIDDLVI